VIKTKINNNATTQSNTGEPTTVPVAANDGFRFSSRLHLIFFITKKLQHSSGISVWFGMFPT
jgi:hypothetical protein